MRKFSIVIIIFAICTLLTFSACYYDNKDDLYDVVIIPGEGCEFGEISYGTDLVPVIDLFCNNACHNATDRQGNIILETYNNIIPYLDDGSFIGSIRYESNFAPMPPASKLNACDISKIESWISAGAPNN